MEVPINHRSRTAGTTVVYKPAGIAWRNASGLLRVWLSRT